MWSLVLCSQIVYIFLPLPNVLLETVFDAKRAEKCNHIFCT